MNRMLLCVMMAAYCVLPLDAAVAQSVEPKAHAILKATRIRSGLCLAVGARSPEITETLADQSSLYVQVLQPDENQAGTWGMRIARGERREKVGVRNAPFAPDEYASNLFNLIVIEDLAALGNAHLADIHRILAPRGVVVFRTLPAGAAAAAKQLGMETIDLPGWDTAFRKLVQPVQWKLPLALQWHAGPRTQIANGYTGITMGDGKLFYMERMELDQGDLNQSAAVVFARDAYNGRTLWTWEAPGGWNRYNGLAATSDGRLFVRTGDGRVIQLDGDTGKVLSEVIPQVHREARIALVSDDLFSVGGNIYSTDTGAFLWKVPSYRWQPLRGVIIGKNIYFSEGIHLYAKKLDDGSEIWTKPLPELPGAFSALSKAGGLLLIRMKGTTREACPIGVFDPDDGSLLWFYRGNVRISGNERYFDARNVRFTTVDDKLWMYYRHNQEASYDDEVVVTELDLATGKVEFEDRVLKDAGDYHGCFPELSLGDYIAYYDLWINKRTLATTRVGMPHPACFFGMTVGNGFVYNFPSRKSGPITAVGPSDAALDERSDGRILRTFSEATTGPQITAGDWPMFRRSPAGGNSSETQFETRLVKAWEASVGLGGKRFGLMASQRTGLTQAVCAYGLVVVSDIDGQRIVALDVADGKERWTFHVSSRVDYPPTLYKGLCLIAARDGWVYCLDARSGSLIYRLLAAPGQRYIGGREQLESKWALTSDVLIAGGVAHVSYAAGEPTLRKLGGGLAFRPETGEMVEADAPGEVALGIRSVPGGRELQMSYDILIQGNSIPRTNEDNWHGFQRQKFGRHLDARVLCFDDTLTMAYTFKPKGEGWANQGQLHLAAIGEDPAKPLWKTEPIELVIDDMVLTPRYVCCVGHYQRIKKRPELWILSRQDGRLLSRLPVDGFPAFLGMSASRGKLFIATREGKLICFESKK